MPPTNGGRTGVALVIGVGEYLRAGQVETLRFATKDATALSDALTDSNLCAFPRDQVILLTDGAANRDAIVQRLSRWLPEQARGTGLVFIYFAGHGMVQTVGRREEGFLLPYDADPDDLVTRGVAMGDLARWIDGLDARAVVVCLDCCHAGRVLGQRDPAPTPAARNMELRPALLQRMSGQGRYLIASCDEGQKSYECADLGHGLFTFHLLRGIAGEADRDGDGQVGLAELFNYVSTAVSRDAWQRFGCDQKPWTSATWAEETYISSPNLRTPVAAADPVERLWREQGAVAAVQEIERGLPTADEDGLRRSLRFLARMKEPAGIVAIFRCLGHASEAVRGEARSALHALTWESVVSTVEGLARRGDPAGMAAILDGLNAFEAHPQTVGLLDRLVVLLRGDLRNRAILLLERKRLALGLDRVAALFREIHSPYQIEKVLGQGLFTETYLARDEGSGLEVVVRVLRPEFANQPHVRARFLDLSNQSVHLVHEKLALTREARAFPDRNIYFAVRDYVPGLTLQRVLEAGKRFEPDQAARLLREVAEALTPLHRRAACHGGIKPSNVFLCEGDRVILGDPCLPVQGIGVALDRLAYDYRYAAPETFLGGATMGPWSDFYSLGCVAYELLCGEPPFVSDNFHELAAHHINGSILPPSRRGSQLGEGGDAVVLKLLARSPAQRYGTLREVLQTFASLEDRLKRTAPVCLAGSTSTSAPLLREASLVNYQVEQSVLNFDQTGADSPAGAGESRTERPEAGEEVLPSELQTGEFTLGGTGRPEAREEVLRQIPDYEILEPLGRGGMGMVYKARNLPLDRIVALKVLRSGLGASPQVEARFQREARAAARLSHPHIVQIYQIGEHGGLPYLALEYIGGGSLAQHLDRYQADPAAAAALLEKVARGVQAAHEAGVLHRDLKPANILLDEKGEPHVSDFGLARFVDDVSMGLTMAGVIVGTPGYMAPEQASGEPSQVSPASDVWALGAILYVLLTGRPPFQARTAQETLWRLMAQEPVSPRKLRPELPRDLETICLKCLRKKPEHRYSSAGAVADDLHNWLHGEAVAARPPSIWQRLARFFSFRKPGTRQREDKTPGA